MSARAARSLGREGAAHRGAGIWSSTMPHREGGGGVALRTGTGSCAGALGALEGAAVVTARARSLPS